jgi:hypothetical protein
MTKSLTIRQLFDIENFDPMAIDVSEFDELSKSMPRDANIDIHVAENLAAQYLRAADRCSEILSSLMLLEGKAKTNKNTIRARLFLVAKDAGHKTAEDKKAYVESHENFVEADDKLSILSAVKKNFEMRHDFFLKSHQFMKERLRGELKHMNLSGFSETSYGNDPQDSYGERKW